MAFNSVKLKGPALLLFFAVTCIVLAGFFILFNNTSSVVSPLSEEETVATEPESGSENEILDGAIEEATPPPHSHVLTSREFLWEIDLIAVGESLGEGADKQLFLETFTGESLAINVHSYRPHRLGGGSISGNVEGSPGSMVSLAQVGNARAGAIHLPLENRVIEIRPGEGGTTILSEVDVEALGECKACIDAGVAAAVSQPISVPSP